MKIESKIQLMKKDGVDIIVPVYNALEELKLCVDSIKRHTDLSKNRLILIDDKSPDQNVLPYMHSQEGAGITVLENPQNLGFSGTINHGLTYSKRDVILLNSDTVVTKNWVEKITECAYSDPAIGTVTPFSNNATLCSTPHFCEENTIPYGLSIDSYAEVIERCSLKLYPRITVAVGFCMFVKREVVDAVGLFDKETFQRGYGEENDFCFRAEQLGYHQVLCDNTYIYHSGTVSFLSEEKLRLIAAHDQILRERYPLQVKNNDIYVRENPHQFLRDNIDIYSRLKNGRKNILYVLHTDFREDAQDHIGGTQFHVKDLVADQRKKYNVFVVARDGAVLRLTAYTEGDEISFKFVIGEKKQFFQFTDKNIRRILKNILTAFSIDIVHVHHVCDLSFDIFYLAKEMGLHLILTLHDFYYICPTIKLLNNKNICCYGSGESCSQCLLDQMGYAIQADYLKQWRKFCGEVLDLCDVLITPSEAAKEIYCKNYSDIQDKIRVIPHGMNLLVLEDHGFIKSENLNVECFFERTLDNGLTISGWAFPEDCQNEISEIFLRVEDLEGTFDIYQADIQIRSDVAEYKASNLYLKSGFSVTITDGYFATGPLKIQVIIKAGENIYYSAVTQMDGYKKKSKIRPRIAFLGGLNTAKGSRYAYEMIRRDQAKYDWYIFGGIGDKDLLDLEQENLHKTGWYCRENVKRILKGNLIDLVCILPIWPETFCYTLSEAVISGVPVLATDIGALGERMRKEKLGWLLPADVTPEKALLAIHGIFSKPEELNSMKQILSKYQHQTILEMNKKYTYFYEQLPCLDHHNDDYDRELILDGYADNGENSVAQVEREHQLTTQLDEVTAELNGILESRTYRAGKMLWKCIPFKNTIKKFLIWSYNCYKKIKNK